MYRNNLFNYSKSLPLLGILSFLIFFQLNCTKENDVEKVNFRVCTGVEFCILNKYEEDLLNPAVKGYLAYDKMNLYYLLNGEKVLANDFYHQIDILNGIMIMNDLHTNLLRCITYGGDKEQINNGIHNGKSIAFLELNEIDTDTIITEWEWKNNFCVENTKVWYNGVEVYNNFPFQVRKK